MINNTDIKANSKDLITLGAVFKSFELVLSLIVLIVFVSFFPSAKQNYETQGDRIREFNSRVGDCKLKQLEVYGRMDLRACKQLVNAQMGLYSNF